MFGPSLASVAGRLRLLLIDPFFVPYFAAVAQIVSVLMFTILILTEYTSRFCYISPSVSSNSISHIHEGPHNESRRRY